MTATGQSIANYVVERDNVADIEKQIENYCLMLCEALHQDFCKRHSRNGDTKCFDLDSSGRKYHKIWDVDKGYNGESRSCHAFIDKKTGEVYKPASYKAPAKNVRFNLLMENSREFLFEHCDWAGSYLYMRG